MLCTCFLLAVLRIHHRLHLQNIAICSAFLAVTGYTAQYFTIEDLEPSPDPRRERKVEAWTS